MKFLVWVCLLVASGRAFAGGPDADDAKMRADVEAANPMAAVAWDRANAARAQGQFSEAEAAYREVIGLAPKLDHPHRRLCNVLDNMRRSDDAIHECEAALALAPTSPLDQSALAGVLLENPRADHARAGELASKAVAALPDDPMTVSVDCLAHMQRNDLAGSERCANHLLEVAPHDPRASALAAGVAAERRDFARARELIARSRADGLPAEGANALLAEIEQAERRPHALIPLTPREAIELAVGVIGGWFALLGLLFLIGRGLSKAALRNAVALVDADGGGTPQERRLRSTYRTVLWLTGVLFYLSLPLLVVVVLAASLTTLAIFDAMGAIPVVVLVGILVVVVTTVISVVRALLFKPKLKHEGKRIVPKDYPKLDALLRDAASAIGTRPVDVIYLVPGTELGVMEERTLWQAVRGARSERVLVLGVALFDNMKQRELRAILAHEYGHFRNADTGGVLAIEVRRSLLELLKGIARSGYALFNPAWWMLRLFTNLFFSISTGASRLQEMLADRWAIRAFGSEAFATAYRHTVARHVEFKLEVSQIIKEVTEHAWSLPNLYAYELETKPPASFVAAEIEKEINRAPGKWDTHPSSSQRLAWAEQLALPGERASDAGEPVWELFTDPETIERAMTAIIRARIKAKMNVEISDAEWEDEPAAAE